MFGRRKVAIILAEFLSTAILSVVILSMIGRTNFPFFVAVAAGTTVGAMAYLFGAHANPVITIGLWTMRKVPTTQAIVIIASQMLGGLAAWQLSEFLLKSDLKNIAGSSFDWRVLLAEAIGTFIFGLGVAAAVSRAYQNERQSVIIGFSLFLGILVASLASNALLNPAVALGVQSWNWAYVLGPILGSVIGMSTYGLAFATPVTVESSASTTSAARRTTVKKASGRQR